MVDVALKVFVNLPGSQPSRKRLHNHNKSDLFMHLLPVPNIHRTAAPVLGQIVSNGPELGR